MCTKNTCSIQSMLIRPIFTGNEIPVIHTEVIKVNFKENKINIFPFICRTTTFIEYTL